MSPLAFAPATPLPLRPLVRCALRPRRPTTPVTALFDHLSAASITVDATPTARGSFGDVFFATQPRPPYRLVLKRARPTPTARALFRAERAINRRLALRAPPAAPFPCYLGHYTRGPHAFLVWRREDGCTLADFLAAHPRPALERALCAAGRAPLCRAVLRGLLRALRVVHARGVVHRDVKPANVLVTGGRLKLIDFGSGCRLRTVWFRRGVETLDPLWCGPERRVVVGAAERFDVFSVAMIGVSVLVPGLEAEGRMREFRANLEASDFDLRRMRREGRVGPGGVAEDELFEVLGSMLRREPRKRKTVDAALAALGGVEEDDEEEEEEFG